MRNAENEFYANRRFAFHLIRPSHRRIGTSTSKNYKCDICMAKVDGSEHQPQRIINVTPAWPRQTDWDINLKES